MRMLGFSFAEFTYIDSFCFYRARLIVKWRHLVVTFPLEEFSSIARIFLL